MNSEHAEQSAPPSESSSKVGKLKTEKELRKFLVNALVDHSIQNETTGIHFASLGEGRLSPDARSFVERFLEEMAPRNPVEQMLAMQMLWQHLRIARLTREACLEIDPESLKPFNDALESAMRTSVRQANAWQSIREPQAVNLINGQQINVGQQQIIGSVSDDRRPSEDQNGANEQGLLDGQQRSAQAALPAHTQGTGFAPPRGPAHEAMESLNGSED